MATKYVVRGATVKCSSGSSPSKLNLPRSHGTYVNSKPVLNSTDTASGANVMPFGKCSVTDGPCSPATAAQWEGTKLDTLVKGKPAVLDCSTLSCNIGGCIKIEDAGQ